MNVVTIASEQTGSLSAVASILHDLRNPLATIHGSAEMLVRSSFSQPQVDRIARNIYRASVASRNASTANSRRFNFRRSRGVGSRMCAMNRPGRTPLFRASAHMAPS